MKCYQVEFERKSYTTICVDANSQEDAEKLAWAKIQLGTDVQDAQWELSYVEEQTQ